MTALSDCSGYEKIYIALKCVSKIDIVAIVLIKSFFFHHKLFSLSYFSNETFVQHSILFQILNNIFTV